MGGIAAAVVPIFKAIAPIAGSLLGGAPSAPAPQPLPPAPAPAPAPTPPEVVTEAADEPVTDTEAARVRASKRRKAAESSRLFNLGEEDETTTLSKSLLGD